MKLKMLSLMACSTISLSCAISASAAVGWTDWLNRDNELGTGDAETLSAFLQSGSYPQLCSSPAQIEASYLENGILKTFTPETASSAPNLLRTFSAKDGLQCYHTDQGKRPRCIDYQVRFNCTTDAEDLSNKYPLLRQVEQKNEQYNQRTPGFYGQKPIRFKQDPLTPNNARVSDPEAEIIESKIYRLGHGYDSLRNEIANQCMDQSNPSYKVISTPSSIGISSTVTIAESREEVFKALDINQGANGSGTFDVKGGELKVGATYEYQRVKTSYLDSSHKIFIARYRDIRKHYKLETQPRPLKSEITQTFLRGTKEINLQQDFHKYCGDKFLDNVDIGASLYIVFDMDTKSMKTTDIENAKVTVKAAIDKLFDVNASASNKTDAVSTLTKFKVESAAYQVGGPLNLGLTSIKSDPAMVPVVLQRFEAGLAEPDPDLRAFNESYSPYVRPELYANVPEDVVFPNVSELAINVARWTSLSVDFLETCNQNDDLAKINNLDQRLNKGACLGRKSMGAILADSLGDCQFPGRWSECTDPNQFYYNNEPNTIVEKLRMETPAYERVPFTSHTETRRFTRWGQEEDVSITQCMPLRCKYEDKAASENGKGYKVNHYQDWLSGSKGKKYFDQEFTNNSNSERCISAGTHLHASSRSGARTSFSLTAFGICETARDFVIY